MAKTNAVKITFLIKCLAGTSPTFNQVIAFQGKSSNMSLATLYMAGARLVVREGGEGRMKKKANTRERGSPETNERKEGRKWK